MQNIHKWNRPHYTWVWRYYYFPAQQWLLLLLPLNVVTNVVVNFFLIMLKLWDLRPCFGYLLPLKSGTGSLCIFWIADFKSTFVTETLCLEICWWASLPLITWAAKYLLESIMEIIKMFSNWHRAFNTIAFLMLSAQRTCNSVLHLRGRTGRTVRMQSFLPSRSAGSSVCRAAESTVWTQTHFPTRIHPKGLQTPEKP